MPIQAKSAWGQGILCGLGSGHPVWVAPTVHPLEEAILGDLRDSESDRKDLQRGKSMVKTLIGSPCPYLSHRT